MTGERFDYPGEGISEEHLLPTPWQQTRLWVDQAVEHARGATEHTEPAALSVATVDAGGRPDVRTVLMRFLDERGPGFVSSSTSAKGRQLEANAGIAAALTWVPLFRAIRFRGVAERIEDDLLADYWEQRPWASRISAHASRQSEAATGRAELENAFAAAAERWPDTGEPGCVPVPEDWAGWRVRCDSVEFWGGRANRLHDRIAFERVGEGSLDDASAWRWQRLQP